jgi:DNA polymerase I-like protein with 3'-5' exonuclease and polymerase domains
MFFSDLLWSCVQLQESGVAIDIVKLEKLLRKCESVRTRTSQEAVDAGWGVLHGPGSQPTAAKIIKHAVDVAGLTADSRLKRTQKKGLVSTDRDNVYLLKGSLSADDTKARPALNLLTEHRDADKVIGTYIKPFMPGLAKNDTQHLIDGLAFSQWFPAPMAYGSSSSSVEGGTVQARPTCKKPALQTAPKRLKECYTCRSLFIPGSEISFDLSQIELRLAALLSGDKKMIQEYVDGVDRHTLRAIAFFGPDVVNKPDFLEDPKGNQWRHTGKIGSFWGIYRGGPKVLLEQVRREVGVELSLDFCYAQHRALPKEYPGLWAAQDEWIARTTRFGYIDEQVLGERRWLSLSEFVNSTKYESTICNFRIQVSAARLLEDVHAGMRHQASAAGLKGVVTLNVFDSLRIECPVVEEDHWKFFFKKALQESDYWCRLQEVTNRTVPLDFDVTVRRFLT